MPWFLCQIHCGEDNKLNNFMFIICLGNCYFLSTDLFIHFSLAVALYLDQFNYDHTATSPGAGLFVHLHSPGSYPLFTSGVTAIPPGVSTDIKINRKQVCDTICQDI